MAALAMRTDDMAWSEAQLERVGIWQLREMARQESPEYHEAAARVFVRRILDMEAQRRTLYADEHLQGYGASPIAPGFAPGGTDIAREPLATLYDRGIRYHEGHEQARRWIEAARLPPRQLLAALIQARKLSGNGNQEGGGKMWVKSYDQIAASLDPYAKALGMVAVPGSKNRVVVREIPPQHRNSLQVWPQPPDRAEAELARVQAAQQARQVTRIETARVAVFKDGKAIRDAAQAARTALILLAKQAKE